GFVRPLTDQMHGTQTARLWTISEVGRAHWLKQSDPRRAVQALADGIAACRRELAELGKRADGCRDYLSRLSIAVENAFSNSQGTVPLTLPYRPEPGGEGNNVRGALLLREDAGQGNRSRKVWSGNSAGAAEAANTILECLRAWHDAGDCPLPALYEK